MNLSSAALILIDFQNEFFAAEGLIHRGGRGLLSEEARSATLRNASLLLAKMRAAGRPVIWVNTVLRKDHLDSALPLLSREAGLGPEQDFLVEGSWGAQVVDGVQPSEDDLVIIKKGPSAFQFTPLDRLLSNLAVDCCVIVSGGRFDGLADSVRQAGALKYEVIIPADATGYPPDSMHLRNLENRARLTSTVEVVEALDRVEPAIPRPARAALLLIDLQNDFVHPEGAQHRLGQNVPLTDAQRRTIVGNSCRLLAGAREAGMPIVFVTTSYRRDMLDSASPVVGATEATVASGVDYLLAGSWGAQIVDGLEVREGDFMVGKKGRSAFGTTGLHRLLRNLGVRRCVVTGGGIHGCVEDTIREGAGLSYGFDVAIDAVYEPDSPKLEVLSAHARFKTTEELLQELPDRGS